MTGSSQSTDGTMTFWQHLEELRSRLIRMAAAVVIGGVVAWIFRERLLEWLTQPFLDGWETGNVGGTAALHFAAPAALFIAYMKLALLGGVVLALPVMLYQVWMFVSPGLYSRERRYAIPFVLASCTLFAVGGYFARQVVLPNAYHYLLSYSGQVGSGQLAVHPTIMIDEYIEFVLRMLVAFGAAFELPVLIFFLSVAGLVTHRHLIRFARYFVVVAFVLAAVITPPDVISQFLLAVPLCILYTLSIGIAYVFGRGRRAPASESGDR